MKTEPYDIVVIGAGIHGAGVAQAAAAKGYRVLVLEKQAIASGTSSRSSKLIHGGLRYLETLQLSLVRECLQERQTLLNNAPELVKLQRFFFPVYTHSSRRAWQLRLGLSLYACLGGLKASNRFHKVKLSQWANRDGLSRSGLQALFAYWDGMTDDVLLTRAVMDSAGKMGADIHVPSLFMDAEYKQDVWMIQCEENGLQQQYQARIIVNASGPWINQVLENITPKQTIIPVDLVQGSHIVVNIKLNEGVYYFEAPSDRRAVFAIPRGDKTMIGTTETAYSGDPNRVAPLEGELHYLLNTFKHYFPGHEKLRIDNIETAFAGLRVLPKSEKSPFSRSRDTLFLCDQAHRPRLISIYGGKLTAYRATAEKVMAKLAGHNIAPRPKAGTRHIKLNLKSV